MRAHVLTGTLPNQIITNTIVVSALDALPGLTLINADLYPGNKGDTWDGASVTPAPPPPAVVPEEVPKWAAEIALVDADLLDEVEAAIAAVTPAGQKKKIEILWNKRPTIRRDSPVVAVMKDAIPLTDEELDQLFIDAEALITLYADK